MTAKRPQAVPGHSCWREVARLLLAVVLALATVACWEMGLAWLAQMAQGGQP